MTPLSPATLPALPPYVARFGYNRAAVRAGIAHLSVGNFHRAHQAWYIDRLLHLPGNEGWGICGIGVMDTPAERAKAAAMQAQGGLYTLTRFDADGTPHRHVVGSIVEFLYAPDDMAAVLAKLADPDIRIVSMTVTEGGYNQDRHGAYRLDTQAVQADLALPHAPATVFGLIVEALRLRRAAGVAPFSVLSCDNLINNGHAARTAVITHARALDEDLAAWIAARTAFPNAMVDGITPAVGPAERDRINTASGIDDAVPVFAESYVNWVLEDAFSNTHPDLAAVGVRMTHDVRPYELAKLYMLNASHSMLSYPAQLAGFTFVDDAMREPLIYGLLEQFMERDVIPALSQPPGMDLHAYKTELLDRFANPAVRDQVARLSGGGAVKLPVFLGPTIARVLAAGADHRRLAFGLAAFTRYLGGVADTGAHFTPQEPALPDTGPAALLRELGAVPGSDFAATVAAMGEAIAARGALSVLRDLLAG